MTNETESMMEAAEKGRKINWAPIWWACMLDIIIMLPLSYLSRPLALLLLVPAAAVGIYAGYKDDKAKGRPLWGFKHGR